MQALCAGFSRFPTGMHMGEDEGVHADWLEAIPRFGCGSASYCSRAPWAPRRCGLLH